LILTIMCECACPGMAVNIYFGYPEVFVYCPCPFARNILQDSHWNQIGDFYSTKDQKHQRIYSQLRLLRLIHLRNCKNDEDSCADSEFLQVCLYYWK